MAPGPLGRLARIVEAASLWVAVAGLLVITCAMVAQVAFRYALNAPLQWSETISTYALVWVVFPGAAAIALRGAHVSIPSLTDLLPLRGRIAATLLSRLATIAFAGIVCWLCWGWLTRGSHVMAASLGVSTLWIKLALPIGIGLMGLAALILLAGDLAAIRRRQAARFARAFEPD